ncbi:LamG domain-containing protein [bacterium]|nr:LamG domain-containing protein [bacterium]
MTTHSKIDSNQRISWSGPANPTSTESNVELHDTFLNTTSGEIFRCTDDTEGVLSWLGFQGTEIIGSYEIWSPDHPDLLLMYTMDNVSGNVVIDQSFNGRDLTMTLLVQDAGIYGSGLHFRNPQSGLPTHYGELAAQFNIVGDFSLSLWLDPLYHTYSGNKTICGSAFITSNYDAIQWSQWPSAATIHRINTNYTISQQPNIGDGYKHIVIQRSGSTLEQYVNGNAYGSKTGITTDDLRIDSFGQFHTSSPTSGNATWDLDQVRLFDRVLTPQEIEELYQEGIFLISDSDHPNLDAFWKHDSSSVSGNLLLDDSVFNGDKDATMNNSPTFVTGLIGDALSYDGIDQSTTYPTNIIGPIDNFSISLWVKHNGTDEYMFTQGKDGDGEGWSIRVSYNSSTGLAEGRIRTAGATDGGFSSFTTVTGKSNGDWVNITFMRLYGGWIRLYVDGVQESEQLVGGVLSLNASGAGMNLGGDVSLTTTPDYKPCTVDSIRIFTRLLSDPEILELYNTGTGI